MIVGVKEGSTKLMEERQNGIPAVIVRELGVKLVQDAMDGVK
ncbi:MAG: hypothetical protein ABFC91_02015 [Methanobacteriaceae archaeon]